MNFFSPFLFVFIGRSEIDSWFLKGLAGILTRRPRLPACISAQKRSSCSSWPFSGPGMTRPGHDLVLGGVTVVLIQRVAGARSARSEAQARTEDSF